MKNFVLRVAMMASVASSGLLMTLDLSANSIDLPAKTILVAARTLQPQTTVNYSVKGTLECQIIARDFPPYTSQESCHIEIKGKTAEVEQPESILTALKKVQPMRGPHYFFKGPFKATSNIMEGGTVESASVTLINTPSDEKNTHQQTTTQYFHQSGMARYFSAVIGSELMANFEHKGNRLESLTLTETYRCMGCFGFTANFSNASTGSMQVKIQTRGSLNDSEIKVILIENQGEL